MGLLPPQVVVLLDENRVRKQVEHEKDCLDDEADAEDLEHEARPAGRRGLVADALEQLGADLGRYGRSQRPAEALPDQIRVVPVRERLQFDEDSVHGHQSLVKVRHVSEQAMSFAVLRV